MPAKSEPTIAMRLQFFVRFHTEFGQQLWLTGNRAPLQGTDGQPGIPMNYLNEDFWELTVELTADQLNDWSDWRYQYLLLNKDGEWVSEPTMDRPLPALRKSIQEVQLIDTWNHAGEYENAFYAAPFQQVLLPLPAARSRGKAAKGATHEFRIKAPLLAANEIPCLLGNVPALSAWDSDEPILMTRMDEWWTVGVDLAGSHFPIAYKYGVYNTREKQFVRYETGNNRLLQQQSAPRELTVLHDGFIQLPNDTWKGAGVAIPVFSLRSRHSFGVGEFSDIRLLVDWARETGLRLIQLLPVNDTSSTGSWTDSYPYSAISAFALHPLYINLSKVAGKKHQDKIQSLKRKQKMLNELAEVDYEEVMRFKLAMLRELYDEMSSETLESDDYIDFFRQNQHWLKPYAVFCYLRDKNGTARFEDWKTHQRYEPSEIDRFFTSRSAARREILFHCFVQYHLHLQLKDAADYAHKKGVVLKGDIAIGISRNSCDAWVAPDLYNMDEQAGAPPDDFARNGQNWEFPTYNWKRMQEDDYAWWRQRFEQMSNYFDAFRIDHILGFFRIWSIPAHAVQGIMGRFVPCLPVHFVEFGENGIWMDEQRFCEPFINDDVLNEVFGDKAAMVKEEFVVANDNGGYDLRAAFNTQRKVESYFSEGELCEERKQLREGLYQLIANVILFRQEGSQGQEFHFRIGMEQTLSFRYLIPHVQEKLKALYLNYFYERQDDFWRREAMQKLPALKAATNMLICGEDLGMVPHCVPDVMKQLGILSLEIQRMPKQINREFFHPEEAPYLSVITPSTHDMSTVRGWWEEDRVRTQHFYNQILGQWGDAPYFCESWISRAVVMQHLYSPAMWAIFQLQDLMAMNDGLRRENPQDERINIPANPRHYWRYRMPVSLEQLIRENEFNHELRDYVEKSGR